MKAVDLSDWKWNADLFNKFGKQVSDAGMVFGYHNHSAEFKKYDGQTAFDYLFGNTDAKHVKIELDVGWVQVAQQDPIAILNKYKDRVIALHVKDVGKREADGKEPASVALGEGVIDWKKVHRHREGQWHEGVLLRAGGAVHPADPRLGEDQRRLPHQALRLTI